MPEPALHVLDDPAGAFSGLLATEARAGATIALTGGTSVGAAYERAARAEPDWHRCSLWWGDERCVPPHDPRSNYGLARRTLLDGLASPPRVHRIRGELDPNEAARRYDDELEGVRIDLLLLGLGPDGHIASLFPGSPQLGERSRRVTSGPARLEPFVERVTLTLPALQEAARIAFLVTGAAKAEALERMLREPPSEDVPASLLRQGDQPIEVYCDREAATRL